MVVEVSAPAPATLRESVAVANVTTPEMKPPIHSNVEADNLRQAVEVSLERAGYLNASPAAATVLLAVALVSLDNADFGGTVTSRISYTLTSCASGAPLFNDVVVPPSAQCAGILRPSSRKSRLERRLPRGKSH